MERGAGIAVIGLGCRFPGAADPDALWRNVANDVCSIGPLPPERFNRRRYFDPQIGAYAKSYCAIGGIIEDHPFSSQRITHLSPRALESTDVAHLWALEVAEQALNDARIEPASLFGKNAAVIIGHARGSMLTANMAFATAVEGMLDGVDQLPPEVRRRAIDMLHARYPLRTEDGGTGSMASGCAALVAHSFGLTGRHMVVDAACASSLAALEIAMRALSQGKVDLAIAGGTSYSQELSVIMFAQSRALSPDGSFPFDRRANGFISSDGVGLFILKRLEDALRDGDRVRAVLRGIGGSCDGKGRALWAPRKEGQVAAIRRAYAEAGIDPGSVDLIEAHATSTTLGDRVEIEALHEVFAATSRSAPLAVGSIKGNIGHTRESAGAAGLMKMILALEHATLPPTGNFREPSPEIPWREVDVEVVTSPRPWNSRGGPRRGGVDAFGIGGLNYHLIVEEAPPAGLRVAVADRTPVPRDIAIVGIGGRFPGAASVSAFWDVLAEKRDVMSEVPRTRWNKDIYWQPGDRAHYRTYAKRGGFIHDFTADWKRYKVPPKLVERNDPLQFMVLESALDALDDAGIELEKIDRTRVAVLVGSVFGSDYALELSLAIRSTELAEAIAEVLGLELSSPAVMSALAAIRARLPSINEDSSGSFSSSTLASRTAKTLDLMGPSYAIDAACASSLASLEAACELLADGAADMVLYGGGERAMRVQRYEAYCQFYALSKGDRPRPFDEGADGFLPGEAAAVCVLKRLEDAKRDGDHIYAVVRGIGSSADGERKSLHKPSSRALSRAMDRALGEAGVEPAAIGFVECHGAGTQLGDATEVASLRASYAVDARSSPLWIGSVKSTVGHAQGAAGAIALAKAALAVDRGVIPPTLGHETAHPAHGLGDKLRVAERVEAFPAHRTKDGRLVRAAGVSSLGLAGINYHAVLVKELEGPRSVDAFEGLREEQALVMERDSREMIALFEGASAEALIASPGFAEFWERTRGSVQELVAGLWLARRGASGVPVVAAPVAAAVAPVVAAVAAPVVAAVAAPVVAAPAVAAPAVVAPVVVAPVVAAPRPSRSDAQKFIVAALANETGYPPDLIDPAADLEADLGIDTVKQAQVLGKVRDHFDIRTDEKLSLRDFPTITHVLDYVDKQLDQRAARAATAPAVPRAAIPSIDLTARRSRLPTPEPATTPPTPKSANGHVAITQTPKPPAPDAPVVSEAPARPSAIQPVSRPRTARAETLPTQVLHLRGTARELGRQHGEALRDQIREVMARYDDFLGVRGRELLALPSTLTKVTALFDEASTEELTGIAEAVNIPYRHMLAYNLDAALFPAYVAGCTQAVRLAHANDGTLLHFVNEDSPLLLHLGGYYPRVIQVRRRTDGPIPDRRTVLFTVAGQSAGPNAVADSGLTITSTTLLDGPPPSAIPDGVPHPQLVKKIAEEARSIEDALAIAKRFHRAGRWSLLLSDAAEDRAVYLEYDGAQILREAPVANGTTVTCNHALSGAAAGCAVPEHSRHRQARAAQLIDSKPALTVDDAKAVLRDREDLGRGREVAHATMNTVRRVDNVMSLVVEPGARRLHVTDRVTPAGAEAQDSAQFFSLSYGSA